MKIQKYQKRWLDIKLNSNFIYSQMYSIKKKVK